MKKYICYGGHIISKTDNQQHFITASRVVELYGVSVNDCILINGARDKDKLRGLKTNNYIKLIPDNTGVYKK